MIRRSPTRIELKLDDLTEYSQVRREFEAAKDHRATQGCGWNPPPKTKQEIHERIGYVPQPRPSS